MKAMVFAAGLGTRLRPLTDSIPKALVSVDGIPMLQRVMCSLRDAGFSEVVINTHHKADQIEEFLSANEDFGVKISLSKELERPLETGGGIRRAAALLRGEGPFLVHNVDILSNVPLGVLARRHEEGDLATLLLREPNPADNRFLLFDSQMCLRAWINTTTGEVKGPKGLDISSLRRFSFCGIHILSEEVLGLMQTWPEAFSVIDFYLACAQKYQIRGVVADEDLRLVDIGSPEKLSEAQRMLRAGAFMRACHLRALFPESPCL